MSSLSFYYAGINSKFEIYTVNKKYEEGFKMSLAVTKDIPHAKRIGKGIYLLTGVITFGGTYSTGGELLTDISKYFTGGILRIIFDQTDGYLFEFDKTNNTVIAFLAVDTVAGTRIEAPASALTITGVSFIAVGLS